jgi:SOS-response transcriptional repressor LexA
LNTISPKQQAILDYIRDHLELHGYPPTVREAGKHVGISSTSVVNYHLDALVRAGRISRAFGISRGIDLVDTVPVRIGDEVEAESLDGTPLGRVRFLAPAAKAA